jgi:hypothetical protein
VRLLHFQAKVWVGSSGLANIVLRSWTNALQDSSACVVCNPWSHPCFPVFKPQPIPCVILLFVRHPLLQVWTMVLRLVDDVKASVREAGAGTLRSLRGLSLRLMDATQTPAAGRAWLMAASGVCGLEGGWGEASS